MTATDLHPDTGVPRPGTCCGACPPIAGGGWDCTCPGNPRCSVNAPAAEWDDLARLAEAATPGPWHVHEMGKVFVGNGAPGSLWQIVHMSGDDLADLTEEGAQEARRNAAWIAAANPATILRLLDECASLQEDASVATQRAEHAEAERDEARANVIDAMALADQLAARLAAVEALADQWDEKAAVLSRQSESRAGLSDAEMLAAVAEFYAARAADLRAALAAPTDTTKEN